jgi:hypothetical protein
MKYERNQRRTERRDHPGVYQAIHRATAKQPLTSQQRTERWFEVVTAIMLGVVAVATAWSGYQATRWAGEQSTLYAQASALRVESTRDSTLAGQFKDIRRHPCQQLDQRLYPGQ